MLIPSRAKKAKNRFFTEPWSAIAPNMGAMSATVMPAKECAKPNRAVVTTGSAPSLQKPLKKIGKKPAIMVVANAEFAQSYMLQAIMAFGESNCVFMLWLVSCGEYGVKVAFGITIQPDCQK